MCKAIERSNLRKTVFAALFTASICLGQVFVKESQRDIPVIKEVDVLVVGGSARAVAAAAQAGKNGASVFLAAQRPYLGDEICRTNQLWIKGRPQSEFGRLVFANKHAAAGGAKFSYRTSAEADAKHPDNGQRPLLCDGIFADAAKDSVQFNQHVQIDADLGGVEKVAGVCLYAFQRADDFVVNDYELLSSIDGKRWTSQAAAVNPELSANVDRVAIRVDKAFEGRYLRLKVHKGAGIKRILLGELVIETEQSLKTRDSMPLRPYDVKYALDRLLLDNGVDFLYGCYPCEVLKDTGGRLCGVVFANRAGRQAVTAAVIIDATDNSAVAAFAGCEFEPFTPGKKHFERIVIGGQSINKELDYRLMPHPVEQKYQAVCYRLDIDILSDTFAQYALAEQKAGDLTFSVGQLDASGRLIYSFNRGAVRQSAGGLDGLKAQGFDNLFLLGGQDGGDVVECFELAAKLGGHIADTQTRRHDYNTDELTVCNGNEKADGFISGDIKEFLNGTRSFAQKFKTVSSKSLNVEVVEGYDVVVIGGGTSGAPAAIAASRQGAKTLVVEYLDGLGGVGTSGLIGRYCIGIRKGFTEEIDRGMAAMGGYEYVVDNEGLGTPWDIELKKEWYRRELRKNGCDIWFGAVGCGALVEEGTVKGAVVVTDYGRVVVAADVVIDSTGNSDIAVAAGADEIYTNADTVEVQGTGLPPRALGARYTNTDYSFADDGDLLDAWRMYISAKEMFKGSYDMAQLIDTRERRRIVGRFVISPVDIYNSRTYSDTVSRAYSNFDTHGYTTHPMFNLLTPEHGNFMYANVPYRCMLPQGVEGIIVTGLGISAHRDAVPVLRMQPDVQNHGYAAGLAAAFAVRQGLLPSQIDIRQVQRIMIEGGSLTEDVLSDTDSFPLSDDRLWQAIRDIQQKADDAAALFSDSERSVKLLKTAYDLSSSTKSKLLYARVLGLLGSDYGIDMLIEKVNGSSWDEGWNFTSGGQFGSSFSELDNYIIAMGLSGSEKAVGAIIAKIEALDGDSDFSHFCAAASAAQRLRDKRFAKAICELLKKDGLTGYALTDKNKLSEFNAKYSGGKQIRNLNLREILLARSLYRCGDYNGLGRKILEDYRRDLCGHYARCADAVLRE